ncbi:MAG: glycosyltransferase family 1 protein [Rhodocyclaceae bacterium]|nr:glycosyltransferase family 1 protein [Rhodocyclaceae bacterium]MBX3669580.1 glycosyltransferase family 1 protein [Rhodocyclaceae bacterium]
MSERPLVLCAFKSGFETYREAFDTLGYATEWHVSRPSAPQMQRAALCLVNLYDAARAPWATLQLSRRLHSADVPLIALDRDAPWHLGMHVRRLKVLEWMRPFDIYATHTLQPTYEFAPVKLYNANAVWVRNFNLHGRTLEQMRDPGFYKWDVSFVGNMNGARFKEHAERERFFKALQPRLEALGLRVLFCSSGGMSEQEQIDVIQRSIINLNYRSSCDHRSRAGIEMSWGLPERCYGVPARGGFMLSDERRHAADDFDVEHEWASYRDFEDCIAKIRAYLANFALTRQIAEAAHARVMAQHTYEHRAQSLLAAAAEWREKMATPARA